MTESTKTDEKMDKVDKKRLDQRLTEEAQRLIQSLLEQFPELRSVALAYDYDMRNPGSLPAGSFLPRRDLQPGEYLSACQALDRVAMSLRVQFDKAQLHRIQQLNAAEQQQKENTNNGPETAAKAAGD